MNFFKLWIESVDYGKDFGKLRKGFLINKTYGNIIEYYYDICKINDEYIDESQTKKKSKNEIICLVFNQVKSSLMFESSKASLVKDQWVEITLSNIENKVLRKLNNLTIFLLSTNGYEEFKKELISIYTVNTVETINFSKLSMVKQSLNESISDFGRSVIGMCRQLPWNLKDRVRLEIENQVKAGIIRPSKIPWCFPIRVVDKQNGEIRFTVDYKELNKVIKDDNQPLPSINDLYTMMTDSDVFTKFDLKSAYHQKAVHEESVEVTAFICEFGIFEYLFMPMGIKIAP
ncbi:unnamed protein product, partial [Brachionus calyciflorus]